MMRLVKARAMGWIVRLERFGVVIIGGGQAGARTAKGLRSFGFDGSIALVSEERHLPYERPPLSKARLVRPEGPAPYVIPPEDYGALRVDLRLGVRAVSIDRSDRILTLDDGRAIGFDQLILATGSRLRPFEVPGLASQDILALRTLDDSQALAERLTARPAVTVIGGGFIGLEVAATAATLGCAVTVLEAADRLLPRLGCAQASAFVLERHRAAGLDIRLGTRVVEAVDRVFRLSDGSELAFDAVIAGVGVVPETDLAEAAGLAVSDGVLVDAVCRTSDPAIFAIGDVARRSEDGSPGVRFESWQNANHQADRVAREIAGAVPSALEAPWVWSDQGDLNLQIAGRVSRDGQVVVRDHRVDDRGMTLLYFEAGRLIGGVTLDRGKDMALIRRALVGAEPVAACTDFADIGQPLRRLLSERAAV